MKVKPSALEGAALTWAMATSEGKDVAVVINDGVPEVWHTRDIIQGRTLKNKEGKDRYLLGDLWPVVLVGNPVVYDDTFVGNLIRRELIQVTPQIGGKRSGQWSANKWHEDKAGAMVPGTQYGPDPITAIMRCCVALKMGEKIDIPESLK